jgi:pyruvate formate lyase activating enzyme
MCRWLAKEIGPDIPLHFSRFQPMYLIKNLPPTPISTLESLRDIALEEGINYVYVGNVPGHSGETTYCPGCRRKIIERFGMQVTALSLKDGACPSCRRPIPGIWV